MTIKEIAQMCNVSISTVSNVINGRNKAGDETTRKILEVIQETGYQPSYFAKGLRKQSMKLIGIIVEDMILFSSPQIVDGIMECCDRRGYNIVLENMRLYARWHGDWFTNNELYQTSFKPVLKELKAFNVDGMIYVAGHAHHVDDFSKELGIPTVMAYSIPASPQIPTFLIDDYKGGYDMAEYLLDKGHKRIGVIAGEEDNIHTVNRLRGFQKALFHRGVLYDPDLTEYAMWGKAGGYDAAPRILEKGVTAIFCFSDMIAGGVYEYAREHGITIGKELSVAGFDDQIMAEYMTPPLTTMRLPLQEIGFEAAKRLIRMLNQGDREGEKEEDGQEKKLPCMLIERESVADISE